MTLFALTSECLRLKPSGSARRMLFKLLRCLLPIMVVSTFFTHAFSEEYLLYVPSQLVEPAVTPRANGVLVKKITIKRGDTLSGISRRFSGKGSYFPQILLFNSIEDPNRIYAGRELLVPVESHRPPMDVSGVESRLGEYPAGAGGRHLLQSKGQRLYDEAVTKFSRGMYRDALADFDRFLKEYSHSPLVPDATLYRADCFLHLSGH